jgi:two-component system, NarL family, response regulator DevR
MRPIRVFLLDDHEVVRRGLVDLLGNSADIDIVGEAGEVAGAAEAIVAADTTVAVLDGRLPDGSGIDVCRDVKSVAAGIRCLILTSFDDDEAVLAAVLAGADGYLLKQVRGSNLVEAVRALATGRSLLDPALVDRVMARAKAAPPVESLTPRERDILDLIAEGLSNREIAGRLFLAEKTVKNNVSMVLAKLGMQRRTQAARWSMEHPRR